MTAKTRRWLVVSLVALGLTLPAETILLRAVSTTSKQAAKDWADSLASDQAPPWAANIQSLPFEYRRALMGRLAPQARANVWRNHIYQYLAAHPELDISTAALLYNAASLVTGESLSAPTAEVRGQMAAVAEQVAVILGRGEADYLFYRLGPKDATLASALPFDQKLAEFIRGVFVAQARVEDCDCSLSFGCDFPSHCDAGPTCNKHDEWPACGWWWNQECNGLCLAGADG